MSRGAEAQAKQTYSDSRDFGQGAKGNASDLYGTLTPLYKGEATNPQGFDPGTLADMNTAAQQSAGGGLAAAEGEGNLVAARNRNLGGFGDVLDSVSKNSMDTSSNAALKIKNADALMKEQHRQEGMQGMTGLEGQQNNDVLSSLGLQNQSTDSLVKAGQSGWFQNMTGFMNALSGDAQAAVGVKKAWA